MRKRLYVDMEEFLREFVSLLRIVPYLFAAMAFTWCLACVCAEKATIKDFETGLLVCAVSLVVFAAVFGVCSSCSIVAGNNDNCGPDESLANPDCTAPENPKPTPATTGTNPDNAWETLYAVAKGTPAENQVGEMRLMAEKIRGNIPDDSPAHAQLDRICRLYLPELETIIRRHGRIQTVAPRSEEAREAGTTLCRALEAVRDALGEIGESAAENENTRLGVETDVLVSMLGRRRTFVKKKEETDA